MKLIMVNIKILLLFTVITGLIYPLFIAAIAQLAFPVKSHGSLLMKGNLLVGSTLIGQKFESDAYFHSRPSAIDYNPIPSGGSNLGLLNQKLQFLVDTRRSAFIEDNNLPAGTHVPSEMLFASASGIDPHISVNSALLQVDRISINRRFNKKQKDELYDLIKQRTEPPQCLILGEERINVLLLNMDLDLIK